MNAKRSGRRALDTVLNDLVVREGYLTPDGKLPIQWPGRKFDRAALVAQENPLYLRPTFHPGPRRIMEWGQDPRIEMPGFYKVGVFTLGTKGQDFNDTLAGIVEAAYPYDTNLDFEGIRVNISTVDHSEAVPDDVWLYSAVNINWTIWRS